MVDESFAITASLYGMSCVFYLAMLANPGADKLTRVARIVLAVAIVGHTGFLVSEYIELGYGPFRSIHGSFSMVSLLVVSIFFAAQFRFRVSVLGAIIVPLTLLFFMGASFGGSVAPVPENVRSMLLPVHIAVNVLGLVCFCVAAAVACGYVIQERQLRQKRIDGISQRLPSLTVLDRWSLRLVTLGFPLLTIGIVTGGMWAVRLGPEAPLLSPNQAFALAAWMLFALVLMLRFAVGWQGRRAAIGTICGFVCTALVLAGYAARATGGA